MFRAVAHKFVCIAGPSGCGKMTLLKIMAGLRMRVDVFWADGGFTNQLAAVGEAAALYLSRYYPERTVARLHAFDPQIQLIALLRHPDERA